MPLVIDIKVVPRAGKTGFVLDKRGHLKAYLKSPPEKNLANNELIKTIAKEVGITQDKVELIAGHTSRNKRIKIAVELTFEQFLARLGIELQQPLF